MPKRLESGEAKNGLFDNRNGHVEPDSNGNGIRKNSENRENGLKSCDFSYGVQARVQIDDLTRPRYLTGSSGAGRESGKSPAGMNGMKSKDLLCGRLGIAGAGIVAVLLFIVPSSLLAQRSSTPGDDATPKTEQESDVKKPPEPPPLPDPAGARRLSRQYRIWVDPKEKAVIVDGRICLRQGMLEMFACTRNTKEHEAIVSADTKAYLVHAALLSLGAEVGNPVQFQPQYVPPSGNEIEVQVQWKDAKGKLQSARAQDWIKDIRTKQAMTYPFVFAGSTFWTDPETGKQHYQAEGGDFVCVSNFGTAMLDIPAKSSQSNEELEFEAFTERIPPLGAPVRLVFKPKLKEQGATQRVPAKEQAVKKEASKGASKAK
jgi:hypothetical protein